MNRFNIQRNILFIFLLTLAIASYAQKNVKVIKKYAEYKKSAQADSTKRMVEVKSVIPVITYDLRYATDNNFMHRKLYTQGDKTFLRLPVVNALAMAEQELNTKNLSLKIWDAYRPYSVTVEMWNLIKDDRYVADPKNGSGHNKGIAVDLTLIDKTNGNELDMGTGFDNFSDTAHADFKNLSEEVLKNRTLLKTVMEKYGFKQLQTEWWHFYWNQPGFEVLDIDFQKFKKNIN
jgi:D-alanyl-D-alanine dipeptidase